MTDSSRGYGPRLHDVCVKEGAKGPRPEGDGKRSVSDRCDCVDCVEMDEGSCI